MRVALSQIEMYLPETAAPLFRIRQFTIGSGERVLIEGPSGRGKTTLLHLIGGLLLPTCGEVKVGEHTLNAMSDSERSSLRRRHFGVVFQNLNLLDHLTAIENVQLAQRPSNRSQTAKEAAQRLEAVRLGHKARQLAVTLSLGERQRVAVARALAAKPDIILADEPTSSLDAVNAREVIGQLTACGPETTVIVVSHDQRIRQEFSRVLSFEELIG